MTNLNPVSWSTMRDALFDPYTQDTYGVVYHTEKKDCIDTGNDSPVLPYPTISLERKFDNASELISNRKALIL